MPSFSSSLGGKYAASLECLKSSDLPKQFAQHFDKVHYIFLSRHLVPNFVPSSTKFLAIRKFIPIFDAVILI